MNRVHLLHSLSSTGPQHLSIYAVVLKALQLKTKHTKIHIQNQGQTNNGVHVCINMHVCIIYLCAYVCVCMCLYNIKKTFASVCTCL